MLVKSCKSWVSEMPSDNEQFDLIILFFVYRP